MPIQSVLLGFPFEAQVAARLPNGSTDTGFSGPMTLSLVDPGFGATLAGVLTRNAVAGVATFPGLILNKVGQNFQLACVSTGFAQVMSNPFSVVAPAPIPGWYLIEIGEGEVLNANIYDMFVALYGAPPLDARVYVRVLENTIVGSSSVLTPSIDFGSGFNAANSYFVFENNGDVMGRGGDAGDLTLNTDGQDGGDAINFRNYRVVIDNRRKIYAGGGGGDKADSQRRVTSVLAGSGTACFGTGATINIRALSGGSGGGAGYPGGLGSKTIDFAGFSGATVSGYVGSIGGVPTGINQQYSSSVATLDDPLVDGTSYSSPPITASSMCTIGSAGEAEDGEDGSSEGPGLGGKGSPAGAYSVACSNSTHPMCGGSPDSGGSSGMYTPGDNGYDGGDFGEPGAGPNGGDAGVAILSTGTLYWLEEGDIIGAVP